MNALSLIDVAKLERLIAEYEGTRRRVLGLQDAVREAVEHLNFARTEAANYRIMDANQRQIDVALVAYGNQDDAQALADTLADMTRAKPDDSALRAVQRSVARLIAAHSRVAATRQALAALTPEIREQCALLGQLKSYAVARGWRE